MIKERILKMGKSAFDDRIIINQSVKLSSMNMDEICYKQWVYLENRENFQKFQSSE